MRVFVAGATGVVGKPFVSALIAAGHEVTGTTRSPGKASGLHDLGATPVIVDGLDRQAVLDAVKTAQPEVIVHQMTALYGLRSMRNFDKQFAVTNELRTKGTDYLLEAARQAAPAGSSRRATSPGTTSGAAARSRPNPIRSTRPRSRRPRRPWPRSGTSSRPCPAPYPRDWCCGTARSTATAPRTPCLTP